MDQKGEFCARQALVIDVYEGAKVPPSRKRDRDGMLSSVE